MAVRGEIASEVGPSYQLGFGAFAPSPKGTVLEGSSHARFPQTRRRASSRDALSSFSPTAPLFLGADGERITRGTLQYRILRAFKKAGINGERASGALVHGLRHTFATELANANVSVYTLMKLLGHESMVTSQRYVDGAGTETPSRRSRAICAAGNLARRRASSSIAQCTLPRRSAIPWNTQKGSANTFTRCAPTVLMSQPAHRLGVANCSSSKSSNNVAIWRRSSATKAKTSSRSTRTRTPSPLHGKLIGRHKSLPAALHLIVDFEQLYADHIFGQLVYSLQRHWDISIDDDVPLAASWPGSGATCSPPRFAAPAHDRARWTGGSNCAGLPAYWPTAAQKLCH
jgi:hypothetical protein